MSILMKSTLYRNSFNNS